MKKLIERFSGLVKGSITGFDRIVFKGFVLGRLKLCILGNFISPVFDPIDHVGVYFLAKSHF